MGSERAKCACLVEELKALWRRQISYSGVRFWSRTLPNSLRGGDDRNDLIHWRTFCVQGCGRRIVNGKGEHVSRLGRYCALIPDNGDVAI